MTSSTVCPPPLLLPSLDRRLATGDELGLNATPRRGCDDHLLDELRQRLALAQDSLNFGPDLGLDANGRKGGRAHFENV